VHHLPEGFAETGGAHIGYASQFIHRNNRVQMVVNMIHSFGDLLHLSPMLPGTFQGSRTVVTNDFTIATFQLCILGGSVTPRT
jgi:hypothetical protein